MKITQRFGKHFTPEMLSPPQSRLLQSRLDCTLGKKRAEAGWTEKVREGQAKRDSDPP